MRSTRDTTTDTVASYAISDEQGARKKVLEKGSGKWFWTTSNEPQ